MCSTTEASSGCQARESRVRCEYSTVARLDEHVLVLSTTCGSIVVAWCRVPGSEAMKSMVAPRRRALGWLAEPFTGTLLLAASPASEPRARSRNCVANRRRQRDYFHSTSPSFRTYSDRVPRHSATRSCLRVRNSGDSSQGLARCGQPISTTATRGPRMVPPMVIVIARPSGPHRGRNKHLQRCKSSGNEQ